MSGFVRIFLFACLNLYLLIRCIHLEETFQKLYGFIFNVSFHKISLLSQESHATLIPSKCLCLSRFYSFCNSLDC